MPGNKEQDAENLSNADAALRVDSSTVAGRRPLRRKAASPQGRWAKQSSLSPEGGSDEKEKRKRNLPSTPERSIRPRLAASTISTTASSTTELHRFFATADPKSKRQMHLYLLQEACKSRSNPQHGSISFQDMTLQQAFDEFCKLSSCRECQVKQETPYTCRVILAHDADLSDSLAAVLWTRMQQHWRASQQNSSNEEIWTCQHCGIDIILAQSDQCFVCQRRWKGGPASVSRKPPRATMSFVSVPKQQQEAASVTPHEHMDLEMSPLALTVPPNAANVWDVTMEEADKGTQAKKASRSSPGRARKVTEDASTLQQDSPEGLEHRSSSAMGKENEPSVDENQQPVSVLELDSVIASTASNPAKLNAILLQIYQAAHQNKACPNVPFRGSDGRLYADTGLAFDFFSRMDQCPDCQEKQVFSPFQCRIVNGHDEGLDAEALGTKFLFQTRHKENWIVDGKEWWTCSDCMVSLPDTQDRCFLCSGQNGGSKPNPEDEGISSLEDLELAMGPASEKFTWVPLLMRMVQVATHNKHIPTALFLDSDVALAFDLLSGLDPCTACCQQQGGESATRSAFACRIARGHSDDLGDSLESILLNRMKLEEHWFVPAESQSADLAEEHQALSPGEIIEPRREALEVEAIDECPSLADASMQCEDPQPSEKSSAQASSVADPQTQSPEKPEIQSLEEVLPPNTIEKATMKLAVGPLEHAAKDIALARSSNGSTVDSPKELPMSTDSIENRKPLPKEKPQEQRVDDEIQPQFSGGPQLETKKTLAKSLARRSKKGKKQSLLEEPAIESFEDLCERMDPGSRPSLFRRMLVRIVETAARNRKNPGALFLNMDIQIVFDLFSGLDPCSACSGKGVCSAFTCRVAKKHTEELDGSAEAKILNRMRNRKNWIEDDEAWTCEDCLIPLHSSSRRCFLCKSWKGGRRSSKSPGEDNGKATPSPDTNENSSPPTSLRTGMLASAGTSSSSDAYLGLHQVMVRPEDVRNVKVWECFMCNHRNHWKRFTCGSCGDNIGGTHMFVAEDTDWSTFEVGQTE